jgi:hypothetical protein
MSDRADYAIWLYGSHARGDADELSDVDLLAVGDVPERELQGLQERFGEKLSLSAYSWQEIAAMTDYGSIFLHHVGREGRILAQHGPRALAFPGTLAHLPRYRYTSRDLGSFRSSVGDVRESIAAGGSPSFELSVLASTIRHSAILGCYVLGQITFGRTQSLARVIATWELDEAWVARFSELYEHVLASQYSDASSWRPDGCDTARWADFADELLDRLEVSIEDFDSNLSAPA